LDLGTIRAYLEADTPRVSCPEHGVITAAVPWARHGAAHTRFFDAQAAWLAAACSKTTITALMRISWRTAGTIIARVAAAAGPAAARAPQAVLCADPFHVVSWATGALDEVRREVWRTARQAGAITTVRHRSRTIRISAGDAKSLARARYALWKNPENLTGRQ